MSHGGELVPDELWELFQRVVPEAPSRPQGGGRRRHGDREVLAAIVFVATSGCTWQQLPSAPQPWPERAPMRGRGPLNSRPPPAGPRPYAAPRRVPVTVSRFPRMPFRREIGSHSSGSAVINLSVN
ncbi:transposase [Streptomyces sp. NPDC057620]|uniref:transposase n=1 Tax=Streptomyces sp. NPDC057620 TaxID=3346185 RepID=UPI00368071B3